MNRTRSISAFALGGCLLALTVGMLVSAPLFAQQQGGRGGAPPAPAKNLKLLGPKSDLPFIMQMFNEALGVQCTYCHVQGDFASDDNPKKDIARMMISMAKDINSKFPDGKMHVTCFTCHRGAEEPLTAPPAQ